LQAAPPDDPAPLSVLLESAPQQVEPRELPSGNFYKNQNENISLPYSGYSKKKGEKKQQSMFALLPDWLNNSLGNLQQPGRLLGKALA